jgi:hypothetical protein
VALSYRLELELSLILKGLAQVLIFHMSIKKSYIAGAIPKKPRPRPDKESLAGQMAA